MTQTAKEKIILAAESIFAHKGIEAASLREIALAAGQKNPNAVQYHFTNKQGLIHAIWSHHAHDINQNRIRQLKKLNPEPSLSDLVKVLVYPVADKMMEGDSGQHYILIMSDLITYSGESLLELYRENTEHVVSELMIKIQPHFPILNSQEQKVRMLIIAGLLFHGLADFIRLKKNESPLFQHIDDSLMVKNLVTVISSALLA